MNLKLKRFVDLFLALTGLFFISPLIIIISISIFLSMGSPIFFLQKRTGKFGKIFTIYKFRTMKKAKSELVDTNSDSARITGIGRFLRVTSLDELPELLNVIRGDMSMVGPRPLLPEYLPLYTTEQNRRHEILPGITGWAQINGRNDLSWEDKFKMDIWYLENSSFKLDVIILLKTICKVVKSEGVSKKDHATTEKFTGKN